MADPTPMDVDDEAPTDLVLPDVMEGLSASRRYHEQPADGRLQDLDRAQATTALRSPST